MLEQLLRGDHRNIHPEGTEPGCVVASPSQKDPDYWYQWTRDSALVMKVVVEHAKAEGNEKHATTVDKLVFDYIRATRKMQHMDTLSGGFRSGGLGEVKFYVDATPYTGRCVAAEHRMMCQGADSILSPHTQLGPTARVRIFPPASLRKLHLTRSSTETGRHYELPL